MKFEHTTDWLYYNEIKMAILRDNAWYQFNGMPEVVNKLVWTKLSLRYKQHLVKLWHLEQIKRKLLAGTYPIEPEKKTKIEILSLLFMRGQS